MSLWEFGEVSEVQALMTNPDFSEEHLLNIAISFVTELGRQHQEDEGTSSPLKGLIINSCGL